jgi:integrase
MAIYQRGNSYRYDFVYKGQRYTGNIGPVSRTVAKEEEIRKKREVIEGILNPAKARKSPRFEAFAKEYLEWVKANLSPETNRSVSTFVAGFVRVFGQKKLSDITPWDLERYKKERKDAGRKPSTVNKELAALKTMLKKAHTWGKLADHPGQHVKPLRAVQEEARFLTEDEEARLLDASTPALRRLTQIGLLTGFRRQELAHLRPEHVDLDRNTVSVAAIFSKNGESRTLPMGARLRSLLGEALSLRGNAPTVLVTDAGLPWTPDAITTAFQTLCKRIGLGVMGPHVMRHTFASRLVMAGVDLRTVQELMGHKTIAMTMRYAHLSPDHKRSAMDLLEARFSEKSPANFHNSPLRLPLSEHAKLTAVR